MTVRGRLSITGALFGGLVVGLGIVLAIAGWLVYRDAGKTVNDIFDERMVESSELLLSQAMHEWREAARRGEHEHEDKEDDEDDEDDDKEEHESRIQMPSRDLLLPLRYEILSPSGRTIVRSPGMPQAPGKLREPGYANDVQSGETWRFYTAVDRKHGIRATVAEPVIRRESLRRRLALRILLPLVIAMPVLAVMCWIVVRRGLSPLRVFSNQIEGSDVAHLKAVSGILPAELIPLASALNELLDRLRLAMDRERRFTADAAHELRTPLAALKAQVEVAMQVHDDRSRNEALRKISAEVDRASHLITQLLVLARLDPAAAEAVPSTYQDVDLRPLLAAALADATPAALEKDIEVGLEGSEHAIVRGDAPLLRILFANLIDNAIRYGRRGGRVEVTLSNPPPGGVTRVSVADDGPGVSPDVIPRIFDRFYRVPGVAEMGSGLGLSIVRRIAESHRATVSAGPSPFGRGLCVSVDFR